jgi:hypothetical protein
MEQQVQREQRYLADRPKSRPAEPRDALVAPEVIRQMDQAFEAETTCRRESLDELRRSADTERKELESYRR